MSIDLSPAAFPKERWRHQFRPDCKVHASAGCTLFLGGLVGTWLTYCRIAVVQRLVNPRYFGRWRVRIAGFNAPKRVSCRKCRRLRRRQAVRRAVSESPC